MAAAIIGGITVRINQLARALVRTGKTCPADIKEVFESLVSSMKYSLSEIEEEIEKFRRTCDFMNFQEDKQAEREQEFLNTVNELFKQRARLNSMSDGFIFSEFEEKMRKMGFM